IGKVGMVEEIEGVRLKLKIHGFGKVELPSQRQIKLIERKSSQTVAAGIALGKTRGQYKLSVHDVRPHVGKAVARRKTVKHVHGFCRARHEERFDDPVARQAVSELR